MAGTTAREGRLAETHASCSLPLHRRRHSTPEYVCLAQLCLSGLLGCVQIFVLTFTASTLTFTYSHPKIVYICFHVVNRTFFFLIFIIFLRQVNLKQRKPNTHIMRRDCNLSEVHFRSRKRVPPLVVGSQYIIFFMSLYWSDFFNAINEKTNLLFIYKDWTIPSNGI